MTIPTLPNELLIKIFSTVSSTSDLYHLLQASNRFATISRPFLYHHIIIQTKSQRGRLRYIREMDKKLVKKLTIKGDGPIEMSQLRKYSHSMECRLGNKCLLSLYQGELLDISTIETLHIINVHEDPHDLSLICTTVASSLVELSINGHQGAAQFWNSLTAATHPTLSHLAYDRVTEFPPPPGSTRAITPVGLVTFRHTSDPDFVLSLTGMANTFRPEIVVSRSSKPEAPFHLTYVPTEAVKFEELLVRMSSTLHLWIHTDASTLNKVLSSYTVISLVGKLSQSSVRFLLLPAGTVNFCESLHFSPSNIAIRYFTTEELDSTSLIPPQFVDYVASMKALEIEEGGVGEDR